MQPSWQNEGRQKRGRRCCDDTVFFSNEEIQQERAIAIKEYRHILYLMKDMQIFHLMGEMPEVNWRAGTAVCGAVREQKEAAPNSVDVVRVSST